MLGHQLILREAALAGLSHSSTWWYRLHNLRLENFSLWGRAFEERRRILEREDSTDLPDLEGLAFRRHGDLFKGIDLIANRALSLCDWSTYETVQSVDEIFRGDPLSPVKRHIRIEPSRAAK